MPARHLFAASVIALFAAGCPRWEINGVVLQLEKASEVKLEEPIKGAVILMKCGEPPKVEPDGGETPPSLRFDDQGRSRWQVAEDAGEGDVDAGEADGGEADAGEDAGTPPADAGSPNTEPEGVITGTDGTFHLGNDNEVGPHENCNILVTAKGYKSRTYPINRVCAHFESLDGILRCRYGFVLAELCQITATETCENPE